MTPADAVTGWTGWIAAAAVEHTPLLVVVWLADRLAMLRVRPQVRHGVWLLVLVRLLLPPGLVAWPAALPAGRGPWFWQSDLGHQMSAGLASANLLAAAVALWTAGAIVVALTTWIRSRRVAGRLRAADPGLAAVVARVAPLCGASRRPQLSVDPAAGAPYVMGLLRPHLVAPAVWRHWPEETFEHALAHELMHLRRRDLWVEALWRVAAALYWFHPLVHVARRRAYEVREMCCDGDTASIFGHAYRTSLLQVFGSLLLAHEPPTGHGWAPAVRRVHALDRWPSPPRRLPIAALLLASAVVILPSNDGTAADTANPDDVGALVDPKTRQERGLGSLHLRYLMMGRE